MENFTSDIYIYFWVEFYLQLFLGRDVASHTFGGFVLFFLWRFFSKLFYADFSSNSLWWTCFVQYLFGTGSIEICLVRISLQRVFG